MALQVRAAVPGNREACMALGDLYLELGFDWRWSGAGEQCDVSFSEPHGGLRAFHRIRIAGVLIRIAGV